MITLLLALFSTVLAAGPVHVATLKGGVDPGSSTYIVGAIEQAEASGASAFVLVLDTPGGLVTSAREIVSAELGAEVPVVVWVGPSGARAGSAGVFLTMAANVAAMAPGTTIGAAHPVDMFGGGGGGGGGDAAEEATEDPTGGGADGVDGLPVPAGGGGGSVMEEKVLNDVLAWTRAIAEQRGRNAEWAESAVRESAAITDSEALSLGVIDLVSPTLEQLLVDLDGRVVQTAAGPVTLATAGAEIVHHEMSTRQQVLHWLGDPNVLFVLVGLGLLGLYVEFNNPGLIVPGVLGAALLIGAGIGMSMVPFNIGGLLLVIFAFIAYGLEAYIGGMGIFAIAGTVALVIGGLLLFDVSGFDRRVGLGPLGIMAGVGFLGAMAVAALVARAHTRPVALGREGLLGDRGEVLRGGVGSGRVMLHGEDWSARWSGELAVGRPVRVIAVDGLILTVEPVADEPGGSTGAPVV